ncbi:MAG TPA: hypothetical protein VNF47_04525 [Streptosporangiaceae bacterium]|nr:hypothetical protein [Streptosporangiaceae bacterium]
MDAAVATGVFTLGGVVVGAALDWARRGMADRRAQAGRRDEHFAGLVDACTRLGVEARSWRTLDTPKSKMRQFWFGLMESEAQRSAVLAPNITAALTQWLAGGGAYGLRHMHPVAVADRIRSNLMPLLSEVFVLTVRLSMTGDDAIKLAADRLGQAAGGLVEHIDERDRDYAKREDEVQAAIGQLRRARDAAAAHWWRRRKLRKRGSPG